MLYVDGLRISFSDFTAVKGISFSLAKGETLAIVGESGSGKSLTALSLMGLLPKAASQSGKITLHTEEQQYNLHTLNTGQAWQHIRGQEIGMIFQEPMSALNPVMKVGRQLSETITTHQNLTKPEAKRKTLEWLRRVQLSDAEATYNKYPHQLSGGQKQRIIIAMALCNSPSLIIADEPTTALDATVQQDIIRLMQTLQQEQGAAMIFITHDLALAAAIADKALVMYRGEIVESGKAADIFQHPQHPYTQALLASRPHPNSKGRRLQTVADFLNKTSETQKKTTDKSPMASSPTGGGPRWGLKEQPTAQPLLSIHNLSVSFVTKQNWLGKPTAYFDAVKQVSFDLYPGEVLGLVGESGSGKSTISRALMGLVPLHSGQIIYKGRDLSHNTPAAWKETRRDIQLVFQDPFSSLNPRMTIGAALLEGIGRRQGVPISKKEAKREAARLLDAVRLPVDALRKYPHQFSGGQRQRIGIARALSVQPRILLCDESVSALDVSVQAEILNLLTSLKQDFGLTYLFISHDLGVVHYISNRVLVMQQGSIVESGPAVEVLSHPQEEYTKRLVSASF